MLSSLRDALSSALRSRAHILIALLFWMALWQVIAWNVPATFILAGPYETLGRFFELAVTAEFWLSLGLSCARILTGFLAGLCLGLVLAFVMRSFELVRMLFLPFLRALQAIPVASFVVLLLFFMGSAWLPFALSLIMSMPLFALHANSALSSRTPLAARDTELAQLLGLRTVVRFFYLELPRVFDSFLATLRSALALCFKAGIAAEVIALPTFGIGTAMYSAKAFLATADLFAWTLALVLLAYLVEKLLLCMLVWLFTREMRRS